MQSPMVRPDRTCLVLMVLMLTLWLTPLQADIVDDAHDTTEPSPVAEPPSGAEPTPGAEPLSEEDGGASAVGGDQPGTFMQSIYDSQEAISESIRMLSQRMDAMFGTTDQFPDEAYDSVLRLRFIQRVDEGGGGRFEFGASGKLSLPGTEERLSLVFQSDDFDDPLDRERSRERELEEPTRRSVALRLNRPSERWRSSISAGLRSGEPIDLLTRVRVWRDFEHRRLWYRPGQSLFWYDERGLGATTEFRMQHPLASTTMLLRSDSTATWFKREVQVYYDQTFSLLQPLGRRRDLLWQIGAQAEREPNYRVENYYAQVRWRSVVHRDWLVVEVRPQVLRERENDFRTQLRLFFGFELLFGDKRNY